MHHVGWLAGTWAFVAATVLPRKPWTNTRPHGVPVGCRVGARDNTGVGRIVGATVGAVVVVVDDGGAVGARVCHGIALVGKGVGATVVVGVGTGVRDAVSRGVGCGVGVGVGTTCFMRYVGTAA